MRFLNKTIALTAVALLAPVAASANTVSFASVTTASSFNPSGPVEASETVTNGTATAAGGFGSIAVQNPDGTSEVAAQVAQFGSGAERVTSTAAFTQTITNDTMTARDYSLAFELGNLATQIRTTTEQYGSVDENPFTADPGEIIDSIYTAAYFQYTIEVDGIVMFNARADVLGEYVYDTVTRTGAQVYTLDNVEGFDASIGMIEGGNTPDGRDDIFQFSVADLMGNVDLGTYEAGKSFDVTSTLTTGAFAIRFEGENGVGGGVQDPVTVSSTGITSTRTSTDPAPVPLPASAVLLLAGLGGLTFMRRRTA